MCSCEECQCLCEGECVILSDGQLDVCFENARSARAEAYTHTHKCTHTNPSPHCTEHTHNPHQLLPPHMKLDPNTHFAVPTHTYTRTHIYTEVEAEACRSRDIDKRQRPRQ